MVTEISCVVMKCDVDGWTGEATLVTGAAVWECKQEGGHDQKVLYLGGVCRW